MTLHDEWDYDGINEVILIDKGGKQLAWHHDRNGFAYTFERNTGTLVAAEKVSRSSTGQLGVNMKSGIPQKVGPASTHQDYNAKGVCPASVWVPTSNLLPTARRPVWFTPLNHVV
jgi:glucose dehydrogenase